MGVESLSKDEKPEARGVRRKGPPASLEDSGTGTLCEMQHLSKGMFNLYRGEREPFLKRTGKNKKWWILQ